MFLPFLSLICRIKLADENNTAAVKELEDLHVDFWVRNVLKVPLLPWV